MPTQQHNFHFSPIISPINQTHAFVLLCVELGLFVMELLDIFFVFGVKINKVQHNMEFQTSIMLHEYYPGSSWEAFYLGALWINFLHNDWVSSFTTGPLCIQNSHPTSTSKQTSSKFSSGRANPFTNPIPTTPWYHRWYLTSDSLLSHLPRDAAGQQKNILPFL